MKKYIGTKQIEAEPMTMGEAYERGLLQVGRVPDAEYAKRMGYHVKYADGYESWSPAEPFEEAYKLADTSLDRMQIEAEEVNGRYVKLAAFIDSGKMDEVVNDMYNKCLLEMQCCTMFEYIEYKNKTQEKCNYCTIYQCISGFYKKNVELHLLLILAIDSLIYSFYVTILLCKKAPVFD